MTAATVVLPAPAGPRAVTMRTREAAPALGAWLLFGYVFLLPVQVTVGGLGRLAPSDLLLLAYAGLRLPHLRRVASAWSGWFSGLVAVIWFGLLEAELTTGGVRRTVVVEKAIGILILVLTYTCLVDLLSSVARLRQLLRIFLIGVLASACLALGALAVDMLTSFSVPLVNDPYRTARLSGLLIDPNAYGGLLATALVVHLAVRSGGRGLLRGGAARLADLALPAALVLTFSRSAWIGALAGLCAVAAVDLTVLRRAARRALVPLALFLVAFAVAVPGTASLASRPDQVTARFSIGTEALTAAFHAPVTGIGLGVFEARHGVIVHNTTLWFLSELGIVGLIVFVGLIVSQTRRAVRCVTRAVGEERALATALLGALFVGLGVSVGIEAFYQRYWWLVFAGIGALRAMQDAGSP